ncbi:MAG: hypothetical protein CMM02_15750 [Rhodopirellula sp.]|nr:hypothetical protein [Rhodopirellula sp.]|tara:strand:+ start:1969 stop:3021 length:1053 start_codon:yes stop_codon:yes gene_type:complete
MGKIDKYPINAVGISLLVVGLLLPSFTAHAQQDGDSTIERLYSETAELMGVEFSISLYAPSETIAREAIHQAFSRITEIESCLSNYQADSEISLLCQAEGPVKVSDDLWFVLRESMFYWQISGGAFDVTVGRITRLWRRARRQKEFPSRSRIKEEMKFVGGDLLRFDVEKQTVEILKPGLLIDLGAIGKGYAADQALRVLRDLDLGAAVINASGDVLFGEAPPGKQGWPAAIASFPSGEEPTFLEPLANLALATSGDAYQHLEYQGKRYSHLVDPRTGIPIKGRSSVSVLAVSGLRSDALASAVSVLGPRKGVALIEELAKTEVYIGFQRGLGKPIETNSTAGFPLKSKK